MERLMFLDDQNSIDEYGAADLKCLPIRFFPYYIEPITLLDICCTLPIDYRSNDDLQLRLPWFVHYYRPSMRTHIDGSPSSQSKCRLCIRALAIKF